MATPEQLDRVVEAVKARHARTLDIVEWDHGPEARLVANQLTIADAEYRSAMEDASSGSE